MVSARLDWARADTVALPLVTAAAALLRSIHLTRPDVIVADELFYAREACFFVYRSAQTCGIGESAVSPHPPLLTATPLPKRAIEARHWFRDCRPPPRSLAPNGWCWG
jgi:hypothetical protein